MARTPYDGAFYRGQLEGSRAAAERIAALLVGVRPPASVLDVGCGAGTLLAAFADRGVTDLRGLDDGALDAALLQCDPSLLQRADLAEPFDLGRRFDLVASLEVAEHLAEDRAEQFVRSLVRHGDVVLFSAAVKGQGGLHHVNEQWPSWWEQHFAAAGYRCMDAIRPSLWGDPAVPTWYKQNTFLFVAAGVEYPVPPAHPWPRDLAHPWMAERPLHLSLREAATELVRSADRSWRHWWGRLTGAVR